MENSEQQIISVTGLYSKRFLKTAMKRYDLFEDFQRSFWLDLWLSNRKILTE